MWPRCLLLSLAASLSVGTLGCGSKSDAPQTVNVSGTVTLDGEPLAVAQMVFEPTEGGDKAYPATVTEGEFTAEMTPGSKKVRITAIREIPGKTIPNADGTGEIPATEQYLPVRYNTQTELTAEISEDGEKGLAFELSSK